MIPTKGVGYQFGTQIGYPVHMATDKKKILVIDDEKDARTIISTLLEMEGFEVVSMEDALEGLEKTRSWQPDMVVLDVMMPKRDGYSICRLLKFDERTKNIPVVLLTALFDDKKKKLGTEVGADAYIVKPFEGDKHLKILKDLL